MKEGEIAGEVMSQGKAQGNPGQGEYVPAELPLAGYRALDLTDEKGYLCGKILADLGVDVIKIEPPGGDTGRNLGPFYHDIPHPERSLFSIAYNTNKRSITLNIKTADGQELLKKLVRRADFVIESYAPGFLDRLGIGYAQLCDINPRIIMTAITPFGQDGPYAHFKDSDLTSCAMSGTMYCMGDPDRPPVRVSFSQAYLHAALEAAVGTLIAHYHRELSGEGQYVDVSAQESQYLPLLISLLHWEFTQKIMGRTGGRSRWRTVTGGGGLVVYPCKDGYFVYNIFGGELGARSNRALVAWMDSEGQAPDFLRNKDWETFDMETATMEELNAIAAAFLQFFQTHTKAELYHGMLQRKIMGQPVNTLADIFDDIQLKTRNYWVAITQPGMAEAISQPGAFAKFSQTPLVKHEAAPLMGQHNQQVYREELGLSPEEIITLKQAGII